MGIGPFLGDGRRARCGGFAIGVVAAALVFVGGVPPLAYATGTRRADGALRTGATAARESRELTASHHNAARLTDAGTTSQAGARSQARQNSASRASHAVAAGSLQRASHVTLDAAVVSLASDENGKGYWEAASNGDLFAAGNAAFRGSMEGRALAAHVVSVVSDPATGGYWEVAGDGGVFGFGATYYGSMGGHHLKAPIVGMASTPDGKGYWEVAADGGIFSFGDARFYGSMGGHHLKAPIVGMAATANGKGYWEVAADGGIFTFGNARFAGSMGGRKLVAPVVAMAADPRGGYWEVASDGGVFSFHAPFYGSMGRRVLGSPITGLAATPQGKGYWEVSTDGAVFTFGDARFAGAARVSAPARPKAPPVKPSGNRSNHPAKPTANAKTSPAKPTGPGAGAGAGSTAGSGAGSVSTHVSSPAGLVPPANPAANVAPVPPYTFQEGRTYSSSASLPCWQLGRSAWTPVLDAQCIAAEVEATDNARAAEGLPAMRLPSNFSSLTPEEQLFVVTDIERVSRGEQPVAGLASVLDGDAQAGAAANEDPQYSFGTIPSSNWWGSNVVSGALNALDANYTWMYDDGFGGYNVDCTSPSARGCWGHRDNELTSNYGGTLVMGAGDVQQHTGLQSLSELLVVVQNRADLPPMYYTWAEAVAAGAGG